MFGLARLVVCALLAGCATTAAPPPSTPASAALPDVELTTLDGQRARLDAALGGRPALVSLWATWCDACVREFDALGRLDRAARAQGALVLAVAIGEPHARVAAFVQARALPWAQLVDERFALADALGQSRVPATLVLDRQGRIVYRGGAFDEGALAALRSVLAEHIVAAGGGAAGR